MSTKIEHESGNKFDSQANIEKNDWEEDDWDDWGDAEDNFPEESHTKKEETGQVIDRKAKDIEVKDENCNKSQKPIAKDSSSAQSTPDSQPRETQASKSSWGIFGGVVSSVLSTASEGLGNITSTVSQGLNQVIGVPGPEELARINAAEAEAEVDKENKSQEEDNKDPTDQKKQDESNKEDREPGTPTTVLPAFGSSLVSGVTTLGSKVINTGLDTLEGIGKKTMTILQENDPLLKNKRKMLGLETDRPNLSEVLKEAKKDAEQLENTLKELKIEKSKELLRFELLFENNCGLVHLEALEILSRESKLKLDTLLNSVSGNALTDLKETINEVKELMELDELEGESDGDYEANSLNDKLMTAIEDVDLKINFDDIISIWSQTLEWLTAESCTNANELETFGKAITTLAETCALEMNKLHKIAELLLVKEHHSTANEVDCIVQLCKQFTIHLNGLTNRYAGALTAKNSDDAKAYISTLFAEMLVATQHIDKAFKLFLPILQIGAV